MKPFSESETMHEFIPILFEDQYFSQINLVVHAFDVDHKVRMNTLQLADVGINKIHYNDAQDKEDLYKYMHQQRQLQQQQQLQEQQQKEQQEQQRREKLPCNLFIFVHL